MPSNAGTFCWKLRPTKPCSKWRSFSKGTLLKRFVEEGSLETVGDVIAYIGEPEDLKALEAESASSKPTAGGTWTTSLRLGR